jgi:putative ABC transport system substrate-binding protein
LAKAEVAVIIAGGNALARAGKSATSKIPILFVIADDPVRLGFVESFKRPGGNMTGLSMISGTLGAKRMELLRELVPKATAIAMLINPNNPAEDNVRDEQAAARAIGQRILVAEASTVREIEIAFEGIARQGADAVLVNADSFFTSQRDQLVALAARHRLPTVYAWREFAGTGGLMSYGTSLTGGYHQLGLYAARILKGEKAADLPVMQPTKFELVINLKTAKALGLEIPPMLLARADEVIE